MTEPAVQTLIAAIDRVNRGIGRAAAWSVLAMVLVQCAILLMRSALGLGSLWMQESLVYLHSLLVLFASAWTLQTNGHVRVDIFYAEASPRRQALIDLIGATLLLIPFMAAVIWFSYPYAARAWAIGEGSREAGGLPLVFLLKAAIPAFAALMLLQGIAQALRAALSLRRDSPQAAR